MKRMLSGLAIRQVFALSPKGNKRPPRLGFGGNDGILSLHMKVSLPKLSLLEER